MKGEARIKPYQRGGFETKALPCAETEEKVIHTDRQKNSHEQ